MYLNSLILTIVLQHASYQELHFPDEETKVHSCHVLKINTYLLDPGGSNISLPNPVLSVLCVISPMPHPA